MPQSEIKMKMSLDGSGVKKALNRTKASVQNFSKSGIAAIARFGAAFAGIGLIKSIVGLGTAAAETASKFDAVFKGAADRMNKAVIELKKTIPATTAEMQNALSTFASMAKAFGLNEQAANEFSINMVRIAGDLASFHDMKPEEAFLKIRSAISGEFEPMKQLGIVMNEAIIKQEALNLAIWDGTGQMSAAQKAMAVQSVLLKQMGDAQGDAAATADSAANKIKFLQSKLTDMGTEIGTTLLPAVVEVVSWLNKTAAATKAATEAVGGFVSYLAGNDVVGDSDIGFREQATRQLGEGATKEQIKNRTELLRVQYRHRKILREMEEEEKANLTAEQNLTKAITDPTRAQAGEDYIASLNQQIKLAGELQGIVTTTKPKPITGATPDTSGAPEKTGLDIERGEFEGRSEFLLRREKARGANIELNEARRQVAAGGKTPDMAKIQELMSAAKGGKKDMAAEALKTAKESQELLKNINKGING